MKNLGFIVNPIAGMGGSVGLKGTDGDLYKKAIELGAISATPVIIKQFLENLENKEDICFLTAPNIMGEDYLSGTHFNYEVVGVIGKKTNAQDTKNIANLVYKKAVDLIVFFGGDGTARDIYDSIGLSIPVIAVPTGVKMYSSVFAINSRAAAKLINAIVNNNVKYEEREILDIDEAFYQRDILKSKLYGYLTVPKLRELIQPSKNSSNLGASDLINKEKIALHIIDEMKGSNLYLLGPGTTVKAITNELGLPKTLLGIDAVCNKQIVELDVNENAILNLMHDYKECKIIVSPIGAQGFIIGRGNKQFTPKILNQIGKKNIIIVATREKIRELNCLRIDSMDPAIDDLFKGPIKVVVGYKEELVVKVI